MQPPIRIRRLAAHVLIVFTVSLGFWQLPGFRPPVVAQEALPATRLEIASVDVSSFPTLGLNLIVTDRQSRPRRELQALRVRENGAPVADYEIVSVTAGTDLYLVVDASSRIQEADDEGGLTRLQKVKDSVLNYAGRFMDLAGRDHVTLIVPGEEAPRVLADDVTAPAALIDAMQPYDPGRLPESNVEEMLTLALERATQRKDDGRFQAIVLYTDASGINEALLRPLIGQAQGLQLPLFALLLGGGEAPSESAVETATALTEPTRGFFVHMPAASDSSELFQVIADNGVQSQVRYRSNIVRSGEHSLSVTLENRRDEVTLDLALAPPDVQLRVEETTIRRAGTQPDTPLEALQPMVQAVMVHVTWPDGLPRGLRGASLLANGEPQDAPFAAGAGAGEGQFLQFEWRIAALNAGSYELSAVVTDTLGMTAQSEARRVDLEIARPEPAPSPNPTATPEPMEALRDLIPPLPASGEVAPYLFPAGVGVALVILLVWAVQRRQRGPDGEGAVPSDLDATADDAESAASALAEHAYLESIGDGGDTYPLPGSNVTIGRDKNQVGVHLDHGSVSALHARIRWRDGNYWLYDEGSQQGTFLNHERLGLAPRALKDGDEVQFGSYRLRFRIDKGGEAEPEHVGREGEAEKPEGAGS